MWISKICLILKHDTRKKPAWSTWFLQCIDIHTSTISFLKTAFVTSSRSQEFSDNFCVKRPPFFSNKKTPLRPVGSNPTDLTHLSWRSKFEKGKLWEWISPTKWSNKMDETTGTMATRNPVNSPVEVYIGSLSPLFIVFNIPDGDRRISEPSRVSNDDSFNVLSGICWNDITWARFKTLGWHSIKLIGSWGSLLLAG